MDELNGTDNDNSGGSAEVGAVSTVVKALKPMSAEARRRVIDAALILLGEPKLPANEAPVVAEPMRQPRSHRETLADIRRLKEEKKPRSANEMAALVAYYLQEESPPGERKDRVSSADIEKYFKQAGFQLPGRANMALVNAKNAGYLDMLGNKEYRLNPVGYNLVVHSMPKVSSTKPKVSIARRPKKRAAPAKAKSGSRKHA